MDHINGHPPAADAILNLRLDCLDVIREYCRLAFKESLSESDADRLNEILKQAEVDGCLDFWLNEADHFIAHELGITNSDSIDHFENQQAKLREYLNCELLEDDLILLEELSRRSNISSKELQQHLKNRGFDPGPIDGVLGPRTHLALREFQAAHHLDPNGFPDVVTREALGLG